MPESDSQRLRAALSGKQKLTESTTLRQPRGFKRLMAVIE
jgi:hypothetical protein